MTTNVHVVAVPTADNPSCTIALHSDKQSYVFGRLGEGSQRSFIRAKASLMRTAHFFLSGSVEWEQMAGLPGLLLTMAGAISMIWTEPGRENKPIKFKGTSSTGAVGIHGGHNLGHSLAALRATIFRQSIRTEIVEQVDDRRAECPQDLDPDFEDDTIRVWKVPVQRARSANSTKRRRQSPDGQTETRSDPTNGTPPRSKAKAAEYNRMVVDKFMFAAWDNIQPFLYPTTLAELKPTDCAVVVNNSSQGPVVYHGPYASEGAILPNPTRRAWLFNPAREALPEGTGTQDVYQVIARWLPPSTYSETSMSYIVKPLDRRGKFDPKAAKALGVHVSQYKDLTSGKSVTVEDGSTVYPSQVLGDPILGRGIIVADIGSRDFLEPFLDRPEWSNPDLMKGCKFMFWILGPGMANDAKIQSFIQKHSGVKHTLCAPDTCPNMISLPGAAELQVKLRIIDPARFSLLNFDNTVTSTLVEPKTNVELGRAGKKMQLMPNLTIHEDSITPFADLLAPAEDVPEDVLALAKSAKTRAEDPIFLARVEEEERDIPNRDAEIVCLGTGSSLPSQYRNVSATLVRVPGVGSYLLDCGEGTLGQMQRCLGPEETINVLRDLKCIVISHLHADHHLGTARVTKAWYEQALRDGNESNLAISCIQRYRQLLDELSQIEDIGFHRLRFPSCPDKDVERTTDEDLGDENFGLAQIKRIPVKHCWMSFATELELTSGLRIAYSGDCRPSEEFATRCQGAHLLVHECTFGDDKLADAKHKNHSTLSEALNVAKKMKARRTLLTHFSQRYAKGQQFGSGSGNGDGGVGGVVSLMAFDHMRVKLGDFQKALCYTPAIQRLMEKTEYLGQES